MKSENFSSFFSTMRKREREATENILKKYDCVKDEKICAASESGLLRGEVEGEHKWSDLEGIFFLKT